MLHRIQRKRAMTAGAVGVLFLAQLVISSSSAAAGESEVTPPPLSQDRIEKHLTRFERIADAHGGDRASGTQGYAESVDYTEKLLKKAGYSTQRQQFPFRYTRTLEEKLVLRDGSTPGVVVSGYSQSTPRGGLTARPTAVGGDTERRQGCRAGAYDGVPAGGRIALVDAGGCSMDDKQRVAADAGAAAVIVANTGPGELHTWLADPEAARIPIGGVTQETGRLLAAEARAGRTVQLTLRSLTERRTTENLIAVSPRGNPEHTVVSGAHLDSVPEGPGINDNGVAAAVLLESALAAAKDHGTRAEDNRLVFGFWGAEEFGLLGSQHYVDSLTQEERERTGLYLNLEMIGSPNYGLFTLDSKATDPVTGQRPAPGSDEIERELTDAFAAQGRTSLPGPADGRSDYVAFLGAGIPTGGLYGGSFEAKTPEQAALWGGTAGRPYDPCYHLTCDRTAQYSREAATLHGQAFQTVLTHYSRHRLGEAAAHHG
uniref:N-acetylpuromycin N-acetylhydrolase n=1 Tax=Streptomyces alboniger TaxID=132473 RepID=Q53737_STRAD|nr:N-acetylpuromycin N-acetylhydrolase [Streptomyces alboniger]